MKSEIRDAFWHALARSPIMMLRLAKGGGDAGSALAVPMTAQLDPDADGCIWFFMSADNNLAAGGPAQADFSAKGHDVFAVLNGNLVEEADRAVFDRLYTKEVAAWFEGGKASLLMRLDIADAEVWTTDRSLAGLFQRMIGTSGQKGDHASGPIT